MSIRWLHLSDFHIGQDRYEQKHLCKEINRYIESLNRQHKAPDLIFISGDIAYSGQKSEYEFFNEHFLIKLLDILGNDALDRIFFVPGNHDVHQETADDIDTYTVLQRLPKFLEPSPEGLKKRKHLLERFQNFIANDSTTTDTQERHWVNSDQGIFARTIDIRGTKMGVVEINSAWLSQRGNDKEHLNPGHSMLREGLEKVSDATVRIVLGHHPIKWYDENIQTLIRSLLGTYGAIYLHGHMHKNEMNFEYGAGYPFLSLQSGASFQTKETDSGPWKNRILSCELDLEKNYLCAEPLEWSGDFGEWVLDGDAFPPRFRKGGIWEFPLPQSTHIYPGETHSDGVFDKKSLPYGWILLDREFLAEYQAPLTASQLEKFFKGVAPSWTEALSNKIPRREKVDEIFRKIIALNESITPKVITLLGAGGEGKSTIMRQVVSDLVQKTSNWKIIWHQNAESALPIASIVNLPVIPGGAWLVVSDYASSVVRDVHKCLFEHLSSRKDVHFLLCDRTADWRAESGDSLIWRNGLEKIPLRGLSLKDANQIVVAWDAANQLEQLKDIPANERAKKLVELATHESNELEGAFIGAMLRARKGGEFENHFKNLLDVFGKIEISGLRLVDIFAHIVFMHADGFDFLSKAVLSEAFNCKLDEVRRNIIVPLGEEAVIATAGKFDRYIQTRHLAIAETCARLLHSDYGFDKIEIYTRLLQASRQTWRNFDMSDDEWNKWAKLPHLFFEKNDRELSFRLAKVLRDLVTERSNPVFVVDHAHLYRMAEQYQESIRVFRDAPDYIKRDRAFYNEWGLAERRAKNYHLSIWLLGISIADGVSNEKEREVKIDRASIALRAITDAIKQQQTLLPVDIYAVTLKSIAQLDRMRRNEHQSTQDEFLQNLSDLKNGILYAWEHREDDLPQFIPEGRTLKFTSLERALRAIS